MELSTLENGRVHYWVKGKFARPNPTASPLEKHGNPSLYMYLNTRCEGRGGGGCACNSLPKKESLLRHGLFCSDEESLYSG